MFKISRRNRAIVQLSFTQFSTIVFQKAAYDYEHSELLLYQNMVFQEAGNTEQALEHLDTYQHQICDKVTLLETRAKYYMQIQKTTDSEESKTLQTKAADIYKGLIKRNPENHAYYTQLAESMDVKTEESQLAMYAEYRQMFPKAQAPQRLPMNFAHGKWVQLCIYGMC